MITKTCEVCGAEFEARRDSAQYCSNRCKMRKHREKKRERIKYRPVFPDKPPEIPSEPAPVECIAAVQEAHRLANDFGRMSKTAPYQLRAKFARISAALFEALEGEGL